MAKADLVVALDFDNAADALAMANRLDASKVKVKVGKELFTTTGPELVKQLVDQGFDVFLDLKFHDIPNTTAKAVLAAAKLGVWMVNVHASGGYEMMLAAKQALSELPQVQRPHLIAVTVLTSMADSELQTLGLNCDAKTQVSRLTQLAYKAGLDGVVCSAREAAQVKEFTSSSFMTVTPGIRPSGAEMGDQKRVMTPSQAVKGEADVLVVGRPITQSREPDAVVTDILADIA